MPDTFDPYLTWLGIRDPDRPPNHYRLLGLELFEADADVIATAADRQMAHVRTFQTGPNGQASQRLLNELSAARLCLLQAAAKAAYDERLRARLPASAAPPPPIPVAAARPVPVAQRIAVREDAPDSVAAIAEDIVAHVGPVGGGRRHRPASATGRWLGTAVSAGAVGLLALAAWQSGLIERLANPEPQRAELPHRSPAASPGGAASPPIPPATPRATSGTDRPAGRQPTSSPSSADADEPPVVPRGRATPPATDEQPEATGDSPEAIDGSGNASDDAGVWPDGSLPSDEEGSDEPSPAMPDDDLPLPDELPTTPLPLEPPADPAERLDPPSAEEVRSAMPKVKEVFAAELAVDATPAGQAAAARAMLERFVEAGDEPAGAYALLKAAEDKAVAAADAALLAEIVAARGRRFRSDSLAEMADGLTRLVKSARAPGALQGAMETSAALLEQALAAERYDRAAELARAFGSAARKTKIKSTIAQAAAHERRVRDLQKAYERAQQAKSQLAAKPDDGNAHLVLGKYLAFGRGQWADGLDHLAHGSDELLADLAARDLAADAASALAVADAWWQAATENGAVKNGCQARARVWYQRALPELTGLDKARVEKRLASREGRGHGFANRTVQVPLGQDAQGRPIALTLALIAPGRFPMGSPPNEAGRLPAEAAHNVTLTRPYYIGTTELTRGQWAAVMGTAPPGGAANLPATNISWHDCEQFCRRLNARLVGTALASRLRVRLPTEAEWEHACRAGQASTFCGGDDPAGLDEFGWSKQNSQSRIHPVAQLRANAWGLYDTHGNVAEWCADVFAPYPQQAAVDPIGPAGGPLRVQRGGSAMEEPLLCRSARRGAAAPIEVREFVGFRVAADSLGGN